MTKKHRTSTILVDALSKNFESVQKEPGIFGGLRNLFSPNKVIVKAVSNISFSVANGEMIGFIGPNGAGKTTTLKVLSGLLYPTSGFVQVLGFNPWDRKEDYLKQISLVMGQKNQLWWDLPAIDSLELLKSIYQIPKKDFEASLEELTQTLEVTGFIKTQVRKLSLGQRMRLELVAALIHKPKVMFLDEPTIGLDIVAQQAVRQFIKDYNKRFNTTVILTSHNMDDVLDLAKRVVIIDKGEIIFDGRLADVVRSYAGEKVIKGVLSQGTDFKALESIGKVNYISYPKFEISVPREKIAEMSGRLLANFPIADITIEEKRIEEIIRNVFKAGKTDVNQI